MADTKVSGLSAATAAAGTNELPVNEAGVSKKVTVAQIAAYAIGTASVRVAAGVPSGAPTSLPLAFDSTPATGGLYVWTGAAWVKVSIVP